MSVEHKAKGNAAFSSGDYDAAIQHFSAGIEVDPGNHVLYSNRSAAYASLKQYKEALTDAQRVVELKPDWPKGYSRLGAANSGLGAWDAAVEAYQKGVQLEPSNEGSKKALEDAIASRANTRSKGGVGGLFGPDFIGKLAMDSRTRPLMSDPEFQTMLRDMQSDPMGSMQKYMKNPKFQTALSVGMGMNIFAGDKEDESMDNSEAVEPGQEATSRPPSSAQQQGSTTAKEPATAATAPSAKTEPEPMEVEEDEDQDSKADRENKNKAQKEKELGNAAYKARQFDEAIKHYDTAIDLDNTDISFLTNRAAVYFEKADYDRCIKDCDQAVERGRELRQDYKLIAKALTRKGNAQVKQEKLDDAILTYQKSLTEHRNADTLKRLNDTERKLKDQKEHAYIDLEQCEKERESGNQAFKEQKYAEAVKFYSEGLKRGPPSVNPEAYKLYSNRAACLTKLMAYPEGIKDCDQCIALKPDFAKGYSRKGTLQYLMKDYDKAIKTYEEGLEKADKDNEELKNGISQCLMTINKMRYGQATDEEIKQRQARGMQDPEVQRILTDPVMRQVLEDLQTDPKNSQHHLEHPQIRAKIDKLVSAGIVQLR